MTEALKAFYQNILQQVLTLELEKKSLSTDILVTRSKEQRFSLILRFLDCDLKKHELLEHAAVVAMQNSEDTILGHLGQLYAHTGSDEEVIDRIHSEIEFIRRFINLLTKLDKYPDTVTFFERRMVQEVVKYVMEQARMYNKSGG
ncbi:MAG: hypothetical protein ACM3PE_13180 [Deltaproteobacteria bacterium]